MMGIFRGDRVGIFFGGRIESETNASDVCPVADADILFFKETKILGDSDTDFADAQVLEHVTENAWQFLDIVPEEDVTLEISEGEHDLGVFFAMNVAFCVEGQDSSALDGDDEVFDGLVDLLFLLSSFDGLCEVDESSSMIPVEVSFADPLLVLMDRRV